MMTNLLCGLVELKVHLKSVLTFPMYKPVFYNGAKKKKKL